MQINFTANTFYLLIYLLIYFIFSPSITHAQLIHQHSTNNHQKQNSMHVKIQQFAHQNHKIHSINKQRQPHLQQINIIMQPKSYKADVGAHACKIKQFNYNKQKPSGEMNQQALSNKMEDAWITEQIETCWQRNKLQLGGMHGSRDCESQGPKGSTCGHGLKLKPK